MRKPEFYSATYAIIENKKWEILFMKRANTGFRDWCYQILYHPTQIRPPKNLKK